MIFVTLMILDELPGLEWSKNAYRAGRLTKQDLTSNMLWWYGAMIWPIALPFYLLYKIWTALWSVGTYFLWALSDESELPDD